MLRFALLLGRPSRLFASAVIAFAKSEPGSESTAGVPRLTEIGTIRSDGISTCTETFSAPSTSRLLRPTFVFARLRT